MRVCMDIFLYRWVPMDARHLFWNIGRWCAAACVSFHSRGPLQDKYWVAGFHSRSYAACNAVRGSLRWPRDWSAVWVAMISWSISCGSRLPWASGGRSRSRKSRSAPGLENTSRCPRRRWCLYAVDMLFIYMYVCMVWCAYIGLCVVL